MTLLVHLPVPDTDSETSTSTDHTSFGMGGQNESSTSLVALSSDPKIISSESALGGDGAADHSGDIARQVHNHWQPSLIYRTLAGVFSGVQIETTLEFLPVHHSDYPKLSNNNFELWDAIREEVCHVHGMHQLVEY